MKDAISPVKRVYGDFNIIKRPSKLSEEQKEDLLQKLFNKNPEIYSLVPEVKQKIRERMDWIDGYKYMEPKISELKALAEELRQEFKYAVWCGMGGSGLFPYVLSQIFTPKENFLNL
ncbi:MAG: phosphoheptose isomerase, partial [Caldimicrobium sp.]